MQTLQCNNIILRKVEDQLLITSSQYIENTMHVKLDNFPTKDAIEQHIHVIGRL